MITLKVITPQCGRPKEYTPHMPRDKLRQLTNEVMAAGSLKKAAQLIRRGCVEDGDWHNYMVKLYRGLDQIADKQNVLAAPFKVFSLKGNTKLPFASFSALPEHTCPGAGDCLSWCYSFKGWRYPGTWCRQLQNTLLLKFRKRIIARAFKNLPADIVVRLYVDGDFDSEETIHFWFSLLKDRFDIKGYGYSKSWDLLWNYAQRHDLPTNYQLNLSSGGKAQLVSRESMLALPITRGDFIGLKIDYDGHRGFKRYDDPAYHRAVREAATRAGLRKVFSCPGKCGECASGDHACGSSRFTGVTIVNGIH